MAQVIVHNIEEDVKAVLEQRARRHGWSMEEEVRQILRRAVSDEGSDRPKLGWLIATRFADTGLTEPLPEPHGQTIESMGLGG